MSLETDLVDLLKLQCPRVFPDVAPYGTARPYITWQQVGGDPVNYVDNTVPDKRNALMQINCWATTRLEANALALQVEAALIVSTALQARPQSALVASHEEDTDLRGVMQDFTIWAAR
jgi:hypothetical protein